MGVVYHAYDREHGTDVALKALRHTDPQAIYRFKNEFRSLADVVHNNLIALRELIGVGDEWFFTMELVSGTTFTEYVASSGPPREAFGTFELTGGPLDALFGESEDIPIHEEANTLIETTFRSDRKDLDPSLRPLVSDLHVPPPAPTLTGVRADLGRLQKATTQLIEGLAALHQAGKLHRDVKPSNVLVTSTGRVVILDFGLVTELDGLSQTSHRLAGTLAYMAPEQASATDPLPSADFYSVGVMLFEALTGRLPFDGHGIEVLLAKQRNDPPAPSQFAPNIPPALDRLVHQLLSRDPAARPDAHGILDVVGERTDEIVELPQARPGHTSPDSVCRTPSTPRRARGCTRCRERWLPRGHARSWTIRDRQERARAPIPRGHSRPRASGRSARAVLRARVGSVQSAGQRGRCAVALLAKIPPVEARALLPRGISALARVFQVLERVPSVASSPRLAARTPDPQELRRRAFSALRELLARITDRGPVVVFIDDLQWGDVDSASVLVDLLRPPDPPRLLLVACYRSEEERENAVLNELSRLKEYATVEVRTLTVGPLASQEAADLALTLLGSQNDEALERRSESPTSPTAPPSWSTHSPAMYAARIRGARSTYL